MAGCLPVSMAYCSAGRPRRQTRMDGGRCNPPCAGTGHKYPKRYSRADARRGDRRPTGRETCRARRTDRGLPDQRSRRRKSPMDWEPRTSPAWPTVAATATRCRRRAWRCSGTGGSMGRPQGVPSRCTLRSYGPVTASVNVILRSLRAAPTGISHVGPPGPLKASFLRQRWPWPRRRSAVSAPAARGRLRRPLVLRGA